MPPTTCAVCNSEFRGKLEALNAEGVSLRKQSAWLEERGVSISHSAIAAHMKEHLGRAPIAGEGTLKAVESFIAKLEARVLNLETHMLDVVSTRIACEYNEYTESIVNRVQIYPEDVFKANTGSPDTLTQDRQNLTNVFVEKTKIERGSPSTNREEWNAKRIARLKAEFAKEDEAKEDEDPRIMESIQQYMQAKGGDGIAF